jgi:hypothetical protein
MALFPGGAHDAGLQTLSGRGSRRNHQGNQTLAPQTNNILSWQATPAEDQDCGFFVLNVQRGYISGAESRTGPGPDFLRLANSLSALYPKGSDEKRLLDAMLLAAPR